MSYQTLFLQQSYRDCTKQYEEILHNPNLPLWDYVVLTASNEAQAQAYRAQISYRLKHQMLPEKTHYAVLPDPDGKRVGSDFKCAAVYPGACGGEAESGCRAA